jgi:hypothetical protein
MQTSACAPTLALLGLLAACSGTTFTGGGDGGAGDASKGASGSSGNATTGSSSASVASPFNGTWTCTGTTTYSVTTPHGYPPVSYADPMSTLVFSVTNGQPVTLTTHSTTNEVLGDGGAGCSVTYVTSGASAMIEPNQSCPAKLTSSGGAVLDVEIKYLTGSAMVTGKTLVATSADSFAGTDTSKTGVSVAVAGTITTTSTCTQ